MKVIVSDVDSRKAFDAVNILRLDHDLKLMLCSSTGYRFPLPIIYQQKVHKLRSSTYSDFKKDLITALETDGDDEYLYLPVSEDPTLHFYRLVAEEPHLPIRYLLPRQDLFEMVRDKERFQVYCQKNHFPVPGYFTKETLANLQEEFRPVVAKKRIGAGSVGLRFVDTREQLGLLQGIDIDKYIVQEKIESSKSVHGAFFLCQDGVVKIYYGHERIRTFPENGGVTVFSRADYNEKLKRIGENLLHSLEWSGVAMIEFIYDDSENQWKIIELNPRLWGSVMLSEACNARILSNYVNLLSKGKVQKNDILTNRYIRWVFPFEVLGFLRGKLRLRDFLNFTKLKICYINFTYTNYPSALLFQLFFIFNVRSVKRFLSKLLP